MKVNMLVLTTDFPFMLHVLTIVCDYFFEAHATQTEIGRKMCKMQSSECGPIYQINQTALLHFCKIHFALFKISNVVHKRVPNRSSCSLGINTNASFFCEGKYKTIYNTTTNKYYKRKG